MNTRCLLSMLLAAGLAAAAEIGNDRLSLTLNAGGTPTSLRDKLTGRELLAGGPQRLLALDLSDGAPTSKRATYAPTLPGTVESAAGRLTITYHDVGQPGVAVVATLTTAAGDPFLRARLRVTLPPGVVLEGVRFPELSLRVPAGGDALVFGSTKGGVYRLPSAWKTGRTAQYGQPGNLAAGFFCYYDGPGGLVLAALDPHGAPRTAVAARSADGLSLVWYHATFSRGQFALDFDLGLTTFAAPAERPADWRDGADLYKTWVVRQSWCAKTFAQRQDLPAWLQTGPAMVRFGRQWLAEPETIERWLTTYWGGQFDAGTPLIAAYWGWEKVAAWVTPDYFPVYPSDERWRSLERFSRPRGIHSFFWPSGYHWTVTYDKRPDGTFAWDDRARFDEVGRAHNVVGRDGRVVIGDRSWLRGGQTAALCGSDRFTTDWFSRTGEEIARRGVELVQVDQVVGGSFPACYSTAHGHPAGPGPWMVDAFHHQLDDLYRRTKAIEPGAVVCFEEPNEWFIQHVGLQDYRDLEPHSDGLALESVFNYLYHEYLPTFQSNPRANDRFGEAWCLVTGQIPHFVPSRLAGPGPALNNGGFVTWTGDVPTGWDKIAGYRGVAYSGLCARDEGVRHEGHASLRLSAAAGEPVQVSQNVALGGGFQPGRRYRCSVWLKTAGVKGDNALLLGLFAAQLKSVGGGRIVYPPAGDWQRGSAEFTVPASTELLRIMLHLVGPGTVWLDDLRFEEVLADGRTVEVARPEQPADHAFMQQWVKLFHGAGRPYLALGRMLHPPRLESAQMEVGDGHYPAVLHQAYQAADGSQAVILANATAEAQPVKLWWAGQTQSLTLAASEARLVR